MRSEGDPGQGGGPEATGGSISEDRVGHPSDRAHHQEAELMPSVGRQHDLALHPESAVWTARGGGGFVGESRALCEAPSIFSDLPRLFPKFQNQIHTLSIHPSGSQQGLDKRKDRRLQTQGCGHGDPRGSRPPSPQDAGAQQGVTQAQPVVCTPEPQVSAGQRGGGAAPRLSHRAGVPRESC